MRTSSIAPASSSPTRANITCARSSNDASSRSKYSRDRIANRSRSATAPRTFMNRSRSRFSSVTTAARSALWMYCRVFLRIAANSSSSLFDRSISRVRRGWTNTGDERTPARPRLARTAGSSEASGSQSRLAQRSFASASRTAAIASARCSGATSGPRGAYATESPSGRALRSTCATPPSRTKRRTLQPRPARSSPHPADCRTWGRPVATTSSSQRWTSAGVAAVALRRRPRWSRGVFAGCFFGGCFFARELPRRERALRIALAAEEERAPTSATLDQLALTAQRADDAGLHLRLLDVLAIGIAGAADEWTEPAAASSERLPAVRAHLTFDDLELRLLLPFQRLREVASPGGLRRALLRRLEAGTRVKA